MVIESFVDIKTSFVPALCFKGSNRSEKVRLVLLADLFRFVLNTF